MTAAIETPAQASPAVSNFVTDVPVQGPTDEGMRAAGCWQAQNRLPGRPGCSDCVNPIPLWAQHSLSTVRPEYTMSLGNLGERISLGDVEVGFGQARTFTPDRGSTWAFTFQVSPAPSSQPECELFEKSYRAAMTAAGMAVLSFACTPDNELVYISVRYDMQPGELIGPGQRLMVGGVTITLLEAKELAPAPSGLSAAQVAGGIAAGAAVAGGIAYFAFRGKRRRRRKRG